MKNDKKSKQAAARRRAWLPGGASRIAYEQRMQEKKTAPVVDRTAADEFRRSIDHRTSQPAAEAIGHQKPNAVVNSVLMYRAAAMLLMADADHHRDHAARLIAAADASLGAAA